MEPPTPMGEKEPLFVGGSLIACQGQSMDTTNRVRSD